MFVSSVNLYGHISNRHTMKRQIEVGNFRFILKYEKPPLDKNRLSTQYDRELLKKRFVNESRVTKLRREVRKMIHCSLIPDSSPL